MARIIYSNEDGGISVVIPSAELSIEEIALKDVPPGAFFKIVEDEDIPSDRTFRAAWVLLDGAVKHDIHKCKAIAHDMRRAMRATEFAPHDDVIAKQIPGIDPSAAEAARQEIRLKYVAMQIAIDSATSPEEIKAALNA